MKPGGVTGRGTLLVAASLVTVLAAAGCATRTTQITAGAPYPPLPTTDARPTPQPTGPVEPLSGVTVGVDPGHNGRNYSDPSYIDHQIWNGREDESCNTTGTATDSGYAEARFTFDVATYLRDDLTAEGAHVVMTRHNNHGVGPCVNTRAKIINESHAAVGIDIHGDGGPSSGRGFAILEPVRDKANAHVIAASAAFGRVLRHQVLAGTSMPTSTYDGVDGITHRDNLAGLNLTRVPLVLIECGNMRNATDAHLMTSPTFQQSLARAMAAAITRYVGHG